MRWLATVPLALLTTLAAAAPARAQHAELPSSVVALDSEEGRRMFDRAKAKADYFALSEHYVTQETQGFCGVASAVMVLNGLQAPAPKVEAWAPYGVFTQQNVFNDAARAAHPPEAVNRGGMTIDQLKNLLQSHPAQATVVHASESSLDEFRRAAAANMASPTDFMIVNYDRAGVGMDTMGHISPLGAYDAESDKILLMDVARYKYAPHWVDAASLFRAMSTTDPSSGASRGFVTVTRAATAPGTTPVKARNMFKMLLMTIAGAFVLGAAIGAGVSAIVTRRRWRKRLAAIEDGARAPSAA